MMNSISQESHTNYSLRAGADLNGLFSDNYKFYPLYYLEFDYHVFNYLKVGARIGYSYQSIIRSSIQENLGYSQGYGDLHLRYYIFNHKQRDRKFNLYAKTKLEVYKAIVNEDVRNGFKEHLNTELPERIKSSVDVGVSLGLDWNWSKRMAMFMEGGIDQGVIRSSETLKNLSIGLMYTF